MNVYSIKQIRNWDQFTIKNDSISSIILMENAAIKCVDFLVKKFQKHPKFLIFCGNGNNGGNGFAIARLLYQKGFDIDVYVDKSKEKQTEDTRINFERIMNVSGIEIFDFDEINKNSFNGNFVIIDALFGTGLKKKLEGKYEKLVQLLNSYSCPKISIDIPSGLLVDENLLENSTVFNSDFTLSFQSYKKTFLHEETGKFCGEIHILDIGLSQKYNAETSTDNFIIDENLISGIYKPRNEFSHKGNFGKTCIIAGNFGKMGASVLAVKSALKSGSGLTYALAPKCGYQILQTTCPEAIFLNGGEDFINNFEFENNFTCGIGPGLGTNPETEKSFLNFLKTYKDALVLDADALNLLAKSPKNLKLIPKNSIITPHLKEFERLFGKTSNSFDRLELAKEKAKELQIYIVLKDHHTQIITPEKKVFYNITGNSGMAKGGSGDVLLGIITSLLAQKYSPKNAAIFGVWLHGKAGDMAAKILSKEAMLPSDLIKNLGEVFKTI